MFLDSLKNKSTTAETQAQAHKQARSQVKKNPGLQEILATTNSQSQMYVFSKKQAGGKNQVLIANVRCSPDEP